MRKLFVILFIIACCDNPNSDLIYISELSEKNKLEIEKVLSYYAKHSQKYKAAVFLVENMPFQIPEELGMVIMEAEAVAVEITTTTIITTITVKHQPLTLFIQINRL